MTRHRGRGRPLAAPAALAALAALLLLAFAPSPAYAESPIQITISSPSGTIEESSAIAVAGSVDSGIASLDGIYVKVIGPDGTVIDERQVCCDGPMNGSAIPFSLTTRADRNGPHAVAVAATGFVVVAPVEAATASRTFAMAVPPATPTQLAQQVGEGAVTVTWKAVPAYPDLMGYAIYRKTGSSAFAAIDGVGAGTTTYVDSRPPPGGGAVQYRVVALRQGAVLSNNPNDWLQSAPSDAVVANIPVPVTTTQPGETTTTTAPPAGPGGSTDLSRFFNSAGGSVALPSFPAPSPPPALPDTGFSGTLPFPTTSAVPGVEGRQEAFPTRSATAELDAEEPDVSATDRRALLVPVAVGSVLCVAALHLRWLNRRLLAAGPLTADTLPDAGADAAHGDPDLDLEPLSTDREPIGAGASAVRGGR